MLRITATLLLATTMITLVACAPYREARDLQIEPRAMFSADGERPAPQQWWTAFEDPGLNAAVGRALEDNFDLRVAWQRLQEARAVARQAEAPLWPDLDGSLTATARDGDVGESEELGAGLTSTYELDLWGRLRDEAAAEDFRAEASLADYRAAALSLAAEIADTWYRMVEARRQLDLLEEQVSVNEKLLSSLENRFGTGLVRSVDILRQRRLLEATREQVYYARARLDVARHQLAVLTGRSPGQLDVAAPDALPALPPLPATGVPSDLVRRRPDVRAAFLRLEATDRDLAAAVSDQYPRLSLSASASSTADNADQLFEDWTLAVGGELLAPIFRGGALTAEVERSEAARNRRLYEYGQAVLTAFREVEDALVRETQQRQGVASLERQVATAQQSYRQLRVQYFNGAADYLDVLTALNETQSLQRQAVSARLELLNYRIALYRALAGPVLTDRERDA